MYRIFDNIDQQLDKVMCTVHRNMYGTTQKCGMTMLSTTVQLLLFTFQICGNLKSHHNFFFNFMILFHLTIKGVGKKKSQIVFHLSQNLTFSLKILCLFCSQHKILWNFAVDSTSNGCYFSTKSYFQALLF